MGFKPKRVQPDFSALYGTLNNSGLQVKNNAAYQTIFNLIKRVEQSQSVFQGDINEINNSISDTINTINIIINSLSKATFWTKNDETLKFPDSVKVIAGDGITLDYSIPNEVTINGSGGGVVPMVTGAEPPQLMSTGDGYLILIPFSL